jgi:hypothetical protein
VLWARVLLAKDDSLAKARKASKLNKGQWKTFYVRTFSSILNAYPHSAKEHRQKHNPI